MTQSGHFMGHFQLVGVQQGTKRQIFLGRSQQTMYKENIGTKANLFEGLKDS